MNALSLPLDKALALRDRGALLVDVRTPAEYAEATIPGAINVPLFSNEERARVGTVYKQEGPAPARRLGVDLVAPRIPALVAAVEAGMQGRRLPAVVFCWRGGMRSRALVQFLDLAGLPARQLQGGHKAFRSHVREFLARAPWGRMLVLRGLTGVGKTRLLGQLEAEGYPVLDLEGLARHRGSAFGGVGLEAQPSQKMFEALLWERLRRIPAQGYVLAEGESRHIGRLVLPATVYDGLQRETTLWLEASLAWRTEVILSDYPARDGQKELFRRPIEALRERFGHAEVNRMLQLLETGAWTELVQELMVRYYDPLYRHTCPAQRIAITVEPPEEGLARLRQAIAQVLAEAPKS